MQYSINRIGGVLIMVLFPLFIHAQVWRDGELHTCRIVMGHRAR